MASAEKRRRNVLAIIEMFANLGLPICDDEDAITAKRDEQRSARNRELNSTKGTVAARAQKWFDNVNALLNRREELLAIVYSEFTSLADAVLCASIDRGETKLGTDTRIALRDIAISWTRARPDLANRWLQQYLEQRGLSEGQDVDKPRAVSGFKARVKAGHVSLTWSMPSDHCDEVKIVRVPDPVTADSAEAAVYRGKDTRFVDKNVSPKGHYVYRCYSIFEGRRSLTSCSTSTRPQARSGQRPGTWFAIAAILLIASGALAYDHYLGDDVLGKPTRAWISAVLEAVEAPPSPAAARSPAIALLAPPSAADPAATQLPNIDPVDTADDAPESTPDGDAAAPGATPDEPPGSGTPETLRTSAGDSAPLRVEMADEPGLAFAGQSMRLELSSNQALRPALLEPELSGLKVKRFDFDTDPPTIVFQVDELPSDVFESRASWSFRVADESGRPSGLITGTCQIVPGT